MRYVYAVFFSVFIAALDEAIRILGGAGAKTKLFLRLRCVFFSPALCRFQTIITDVILCRVDMEGSGCCRGWGV